MHARITRPLATYPANLCRIHCGVAASHSGPPRPFCTVKAGTARGFCENLSVAAKKGAILAAKWSRAREPCGRSLSLFSGDSFPERPGAVKGAPLLGAAKRTLDSEDRSEMIAEEGKARRKVGEKWSAKMAPSAAASNKNLSTNFGSRPDGASGALPGKAARAKKRNEGRSIGP